MKTECPQCGARITLEAQQWAFDRFRHETCPECGWHGERIFRRPVMPVADYSGLKFSARRVA